MRTHLLAALLLPSVASAQAVSVSVPVETFHLANGLTVVVHEDLTSLINEEIAQTTYRLTAIATLLLTPGLIVGMLGANVGGIPGRTHPLGFVVLTLLIAAMLSTQWIIFRRWRWL